MNVKFAPGLNKLIKAPRLEDCTLLLLLLSPEKNQIENLSASVNRERLKTDGIN